MKTKLLLIYLFFISSIAFSQTFELKGTVLEFTTNSPLPGVSISLNGKITQSTTGFDGSFRIPNVSKGAVLRFTSVGFKDYDFTVINEQPIKIKLQTGINALTEIVVVGYGSKKRKDVTGAVAVISNKTIDELRPVKLEQALQGTISGVNVTSQSGAPGSPFNVRIRGVGTNVDPNAFVLIDGAVGDMSLLNPNDVESITVLKDAQAAVYGTIGANGIIIVTTKQGKRNSKTKYSFNSSTGIQEASNKLNLLNATEYQLLLNESYANGGRDLPFPTISPTLGKGTNWQDEVLKKAFILSNDFSVSGGSDNINYSLSASNVKQSGIVGGDKSGFERTTARLALGVDLSPKIKLQTNFIYTFADRKSLPENGNSSVLYNAANVPPTLSVYSANSTFTTVPFNGIGGEIINPLAQIDNSINDYQQRKLNGNIKLTFDVVKNFKLTGRLGFNNSTDRSKVFSKIFDYGGTAKFATTTRSSVFQSKNENLDYTFDFFGEYEFTVLNNNKFKFTLGTTRFQTTGSNLEGTGYDVPYNAFEYADLSATNGKPDGITSHGYEYDDRRLSHFAFLDYGYKGKYLFTATVRRDLSTKFGPNNRVGIFPSVTGGWVVSEESFLKNSKFLNFMKIRGSYGILGNDKIGSNGYIGGLGGQGTYFFNGVLTNGRAIGALPNPNIKWEEAKKFDVGLDLKLWNNKIDITTDYFDETRANLLIQNVPVSGITGSAGSGSSSPTVNGGSINNKGYEFAINYKDNLTKNFNFNLGFNITQIKNVATQINNGTGFIDGGGFGTTQSNDARFEVGHQIGYFYGYVADGIFQNQQEIAAHPSQSKLGAAVTSPGDIRFKDVDGNGVIDEKDKTDLGSYLPNYTLGFNVNLYYKNLDFIAYSYASVGNKLIRSYENTSTDVNRLNYILDRWTGEGTSNTVPRVTTGATNNNVFSSYFVEDASFLRIQNVQLGYTVNNKFATKMGISKLRFYVSANNLYTFTKYRGYDPTALNSNNLGDGRGINTIGSGNDNGQYPAPRIYLLGVNLNF